MIMKHLLLCEVKSLVNYTLKIICSDRQTAENLYSSIGSIFTLLSKTADITVILTVQCILFKGYSECSAVGAWSITDIQSKGFQFLQSIWITHSSCSFLLCGCGHIPRPAPAAEFYAFCLYVGVFIGLFVTWRPYWLQNMQMKGWDLNSNCIQCSIMILQSSLHSAMHTQHIKVKEPKWLD